MYLIKDNEKEDRVRYPGGPRENVCSRGQKNRDQAQDRAHELDITYGMIEDGKEDFLYVKER